MTNFLIEIYVCMYVCMWVRLLLQEKDFTQPCNLNHFLNPQVRNSWGKVWKGITKSRSTPYLLTNFTENRSENIIKFFPVVRETDQIHHDLILTPSGYLVRLQAQRILHEMRTPSAAVHEFSVKLVAETEPIELIRYTTLLPSLLFF